MFGKNNPGDSQKKSHTGNTDPISFSNETPTNPGDADLANYCSMIIRLNTKK